jgi:hypothetical protein
MKSAPRRFTRQRTTPVSISMASSFSTMFSPAAFFADARCATTSKGPSLLTAPGAAECPLHFTEPSGQYASGQLCSGMRLPPAARSAKLFADFTLPRGQGVPHVTPWATLPAWSSSQRTQAPAPGLAATGLATDACAAALRVMATAALLAALVDRN